MRLPLLLESWLRGAGERNAPRRNIEECERSVCFTQRDGPQARKREQSYPVAVVKSRVLLLPTLPRPRGLLCARWCWLCGGHSPGPRLAAGIQLRGAGPVVLIGSFLEGGSSRMPQTPRSSGPLARNLLRLCSHKSCFWHHEAKWRSVKANPSWQRPVPARPAGSGRPAGRPDCRAAQIPRWPVWSRV